jgi:hypothetical protein
MSKNRERGYGMNSSGSKQEQITSPNRWVISLNGSTIVRFSAVSLATNT